MSQGISVVDASCDWWRGTRYAAPFGYPAALLQVGVLIEPVRHNAAAGWRGRTGIWRRPAHMRSGTPT
jgi:hypothetical protein